MIAVSLVTLAGATPAFAKCDEPVLLQNGVLPLGHDVAALALGDVNRDGIVDLVTTSTTGGTVKVNLGDGGAWFGQPLTYTAAGADDIALADLDGDTYLDIIVSKEPAQTAECVSFGSCASFQVLLNDGDGTFGTATPTVIPYAASISGLDADDFDGDGKIDVVVGAPPLTASDPAMHVFLGNGSGGFPTRNSWAVTGAVLDVVGIKRDAGAAAVIALLNAMQTITSARVVMYPIASSPNPQPSWTREVTGALLQGSLTEGALFGDDDLLDVALAATSTSHVYNITVHSIETSMPYHDPLAIRMDGSMAFTGIAAADLDESGRDDVAISTDSLYWLIKGSNGLDWGPLMDGIGMNRVAAADLNNDARTDLVFLDVFNDTAIPVVNFCTSRHATAVLNGPSWSSYGESVTFTTTITPKAGAPLPTGTVTLYNGTEVLGSAPLSAAGDSATAAVTVAKLPLKSEPYHLHAVYEGNDEFGALTTNTVEHVVNRPPFGPPLDVVATGNGSAGAITIRWVGTMWASTNEVMRRENGQWVLIGSTLDDVFVDTNVVNTKAYVYAVRTVGDAGNGPETTELSNTDIATTATLVLPGDKKIRASDILTTRQLIASLRAAVGASPFTFTDATLAGQAIKAVHLTELRAAVTPPRNAIGLPPLTFTNATPTVRVTTVKQVDIQEIRSSFQ